MYTLLKQTTLLSIVLLLCVGCAADGSEELSEEDNDDFPRELSTQYEQIHLEEVAAPFESPWSVAFLPDGRQLITERPGRLNLVDEGAATEVSGLPEVATNGQGGLLDVSVHPDYEENGWIYLTYSKPDDEGDTATALIRGELEGDRLANVEELFVQNRHSSPGRHYGSRLAWTPDGKLLMSVGDRGADPPRAQDLSDHAGSLLRLNDDGSAPDDNPFAGREDAADEIYSYGHRNIQGIVIDEENDEIWAVEHGPRGGDELNLIEPGNNYGWPTVTRGRDYGSEGPFPDSEARSRDEMIDPIREFLPTQAPSGLALVTGDDFSAWEGNLLVGGLGSERIRRVVLEDYEVIHEEELLLQEIGRIRDVRVGPDGLLYVLNDMPEGGLYRIEPESEE